MIKSNYANAITEVLEYLKGIRKEDVNKIPKEFIEYLNENSSKEYKVDFDYTKPLKELSLLPETKGIIAFICYNYWCERQEEKNELYDKLNDNEKKIQEELSKEYAHMQKDKEVNVEKDEKAENLPVENEVKNKSIIRNIYQRIIDFFKNINKKS